MESRASDTNSIAQVSRPSSCPSAWHVPLDSRTISTGIQLETDQAFSCVCSIQALLSAPNPDDPLAENVAKHWKENEQEAVATGKSTHPSTQTCSSYIQPRGNPAMLFTHATSWAPALAATVSSCHLYARRHDGACSAIAEMPVCCSQGVDKDVCIAIGAPALCKHKGHRAARNRRKGAKGRTESGTCELPCTRPSCRMQMMGLQLVSVQYRREEESMLHCMKQDITLA